MRRKHLDHLQGVRDGKRAHHFLCLLCLWILVHLVPQVEGYFLGDSKAVLRGCSDHWTLRSRARVPLLFQLTVCVDVRVPGPGRWTAFSYSSPRRPRPDLALQGDGHELHAWLLGVRHRFPVRLALGRWHRLCLRRDATRHSFVLEVGGGVHQRTVISRAIPPAGRLRLGCRPGEAPPGAAPGAVELYMFRVWDDVRRHAPCEDGSVVGWDSSQWAVTRAGARVRDGALHCAYTTAVSPTTTTPATPPPDNSTATSVQLPTTPTTTPTANSTTAHAQTTLTTTPTANSTTAHAQTTPTIHFPTTPTVVPQSNTTTDNPLATTSETTTVDDPVISTPSALSNNTSPPIAPAALLTAPPTLGTPINNITASTPTTATTMTLTANYTASGPGATPSVLLTDTTGAVVVQCDFSQFCASETAFYRMILSVKATGPNKSEEDINSWIRSLFDVHPCSPNDETQNTSDMAVTSRLVTHNTDKAIKAESKPVRCQLPVNLLQNIEVNCDDKEDSRRTNCTALLQLSQPVNTCDLRQLMQRQEEDAIQANLLGDVERVGKGLCLDEDMVPPGDGMVRCTSSMPYSEVCLSEGPVNVTCSYMETGVVPVELHQTESQPCDREEQHYCSCDRFCAGREASEAYYALAIHVSSPNTTIADIKDMLSLLELQELPCDSPSLCEQISTVSAHFVGAHLECHGAKTRLHTCMVAVMLTQPVDVCTVSAVLAALLQNSSDLTHDGLLSRMAICGPSETSLSPDSRFTWVSTDLSTAQTCDVTDNVLFACNEGETLSVLLNESCEMPPLQNVTPNPSLYTPFTETSELASPSTTTSISAVSPTWEDMALNSTTHQPTTATPLNTVTQPNTATPLHTVTQLNTTALDIVMQPNTTAAPLNIVTQLNTTATPLNTDTQPNTTTPPNTGTQLNTTATPLSTVIQPNTTALNTVSQLNTTATPLDMVTQLNTIATPLSTDTQPNTTTPANIVTQLNTTTLNWTKHNTTTYPLNTTQHNTIPSQPKTTQLTTTELAQTSTQLGTTERLLNTTQVNTTTRHTTQHNTTAFLMNTIQLNTTTLPLNWTKHNTTTYPLNTTQHSTTALLLNTTVITTELLLNSTQLGTTALPLSTTTPPTDTTQLNTTAFQLNTMQDNTTVIILNTTTALNRTAHNATVPPHDTTALSLNTTARALDTTQLNTTAFPTNTTQLFTSYHQQNTTQINTTALPPHITTQQLDTTAVQLNITTESYTTALPSNTTQFSTTAFPTTAPLLNTTQLITTPPPNTTQFITTAPPTNTTQLNTLALPTNTTQFNTTVPSLKTTQLNTTAPPLNTTHPNRTAPLRNITQANTTLPRNTAQPSTTGFPIYSVQLNTTAPPLNTTQFITTSLPQNTTQFSTTAFLINTKPLKTTASSLSTTQFNTTAPPLSTTQLNTTAPALNTTQFKTTAFSLTTTQFNATAFMMNTTHPNTTALSRNLTQFNPTIILLNTTQPSSTAFPINTTQLNTIDPIQSTTQINTTALPPHITTQLSTTAFQLNTTSESNTAAPASNTTQFNTTAFQLTTASESNAAAPASNTTQFNTTAFPINTIQLNTTTPHLNTTQFIARVIPLNITENRAFLQNITAEFNTSFSQNATHFNTTPQSNTRATTLNTAESYTTAHLLNTTLLNVTNIPLNTSEQNTTRQNTSTTSYSIWNGTTLSPNITTTSIAHTTPPRASTISRPPPTTAMSSNTTTTASPSVIPIGLTQSNTATTGAIHTTSRTTTTSRRATTTRATSTTTKQATATTTKPATTTATKLATTTTTARATRTTDSSGIIRPPVEPSVTTPTSTATTTTSTTTTIAVTTTKASPENQANELLNQTKDVLALNSSQVEQLVTQLEDLLSGPNVSLALGRTMLSVIDNLLDGSADTLASSSNRLIRAVDSLGLKLVVQDNSEIIVSGSLALAVKKVDGASFEGAAFFIANPSDPQVVVRGGRRAPRRAVRSSSPLGSITLTSSLMEGLSLQEQQQASRVQFTFFHKSTLFQDRALGERLINTHILGTSVANLSISGLRENVEFTLRNIEPVPGNFVASCVFWDFRQNGGSGGWNSNGCSLQNTSTENQTVCSCSHLTSFAVLLDISREGLTSRLHATILTYITYIGCGISAIFLSVTLLSYLAFEKVRRDIPSKILIQLSFALLLLNLVFLLDSWLALYPAAVGLCISTAFFLHYFLLASFTWMALEALHMYLAIVKVFNSYMSRYMLKFSLVGWGVPLAVVVVVIAVDKNNYGLVGYGKYDDGTTDDFCWLRNDIAFYVAVVAYFCVVFVLNLAMFVVVMVQLHRIKRQNPHNNQHRSGLHDLRSVAGLTFLLGLTWGFAFFAWGPVNLAFMYLFAIFNSLQGFFIFVFHCAIKENVRRQWRTYLCCGRLRLAENSDWSRTATQNNTKKSSVVVANSVHSSHSMLTQSASRSSSMSSDSTEQASGIGSPHEDSVITVLEDYNGDVVLNEINSRHRSLHRPQ